MKKGWIGGVCSTMGDYFKINPNTFRIAWVIATLIFGGLPILLYGAATLVLLLSNYK